MDLEAFRGGESEALSEAIDHWGPFVVRLARHGFVVFDSLTLGAEPEPLRIGPWSDDKEIEALATLVLVQAFGLPHRAEVSTEQDVVLAVLQSARVELFRRAEKAAILTPVPRLPDPPEPGPGASPADLGHGPFLDGLIDALARGARLSDVLGPIGQPESPLSDKARDDALALLTRPKGFGRLRLFLAAGGVAAGLAVASVFGQVDAAEEKPGIEVRCQPACVEGATAEIAVVAPLGAAHLAVVLARPGAAMLWWSGEDGGTIPIALGRKDWQVRLLLPETVRIPAGFDDAHAIAVFTEYAMSREQILDWIQRPDAKAAGVWTATTAVTRDKDVTEVERLE